MNQTLPIFEFSNLRRAFFLLTFLLGVAVTPPAFAQVPTPIAVPNCVGGQTFVDEYTSNASLTNYSYGDAGWIASNAASLGYTTTGGVLVNNPPAGTTQANGAYLTVNNSLFSSSNTDYTVQADFEMDSTTTGLYPGLFGIVFRETATGQAYIFQWNGFAGGWQIEKQTMTGGYGYSYIGPTLSTPAYTAGTWVHLTVVVTGNLFNCYVDFGTGPQLLISASDPGTNQAAYPSGGVGIRTDNIYQPNVVRIANYMASTCGAAATPTPTETPTPTYTPVTSGTPTNTFTPTITSTPTISTTPTVSPTITNTPTITPTQGPDIFHVAQNVFNPGTGSVSIFINTPTLGDYKMKIYNSAGEFINDLGLGTPMTGTSHSFTWNGTDTAGTPCASGVYIIYYRELLGAHMAKIVLLH